MPMLWLTRALRSTVFAVALIAVLASSVIGTTLWALQLSAAVATMSANAAAAAVRHRKELAEAVARTKAKARLRRLVAAVPFVGAGAIVYFEDQDYRDWLAENPSGTPGEYVCDVARLSAEVIDEVLAELPEGARPRPETVLSWMPECESAREQTGVDSKD